MSRPLRAFACLVLCVALATPTARAEPWDAAGWLERWLAKIGSIWADNGCGLDPNGHCKPAPRDNGCSIDPNGLCKPAPRENGCGIDPDGHCGMQP